MRKPIMYRLSAILGALILVLLSQSPARADGFNVNVDTSSLEGNPPGTFALGFVLIDASLTGDGNNTVTLSDFAFGAGGAPGSVIPSMTSTIANGASGGLTSGITLTDLDPSGITSFASSFTPGSELSFAVNMTLFKDPTPTPSGFTGDQFDFFILQNGLPITTTDTGTDTLATFTIGGPGPETFFIVATPEPSSLLFLGTGFITLAGLLRRRLHS